MHACMWRHACTHIHAYKHVQAHTRKLRTRANTRTPQEAHLLSSDRPFTAAMMFLFSLNLLLTFFLVVCSGIEGSWDPRLLMVMGGAHLVALPVYHLYIKHMWDCGKGVCLSGQGFALPTPDALPDFRVSPFSRWLFSVSITKITCTFINVCVLVCLRCWHSNDISYMKLEDVRIAHISLKKNAPGTFACTSI